MMFLSGDMLFLFPPFFLLSLTYFFFFLLLLLLLVVVVVVMVLFPRLLRVVICLWEYASPPSLSIELSSSQSSSFPLSPYFPLYLLSGSVGEGHMADFAAFREYQTRSSIIAEKERVVDLHRRVLQDLSQNVQMLGEECKRWEEQLHQQRLRFAQRKAVQDEKVNAKENKGRVQRERVAALDAEETRLRNEISDREEKMQRIHEELQQRESLSSKTREVKEALTRLKCQLEERDAKVMMLETRVAKAEMAAEKRHALIEKRLPELPLARVGVEDKEMSGNGCNGGGGLEETAGESILLIDEFN